MSQTVDWLQLISLIPSNPSVVQHSLIRLVERKNTILYPLRIHEALLEQIRRACSPEDVDGEPLDSLEAAIANQDIVMGCVRVLEALVARDDLNISELEVKTVSAYQDHLSSAISSLCSPCGSHPDWQLRLLEYATSIVPVDASRASALLKLYSKWLAQPYHPIAWPSARRLIAHVCNASNGKFLSAFDISNCFKDLELSQEAVLYCLPSIIPSGGDALRSRELLRALAGRVLFPGVGIEVDRDSRGSRKRRRTVSESDSETADALAWVIECLENSNLSEEQKSADKDIACRLYAHLDT